MASSYYPVATDTFFDNTQSQSIASPSHYSSYQGTKATNQNYSDDDDDLDALRNAALKTLNPKKRKNNYDHSPTHRNSRSSSRSYSSRSSYTHSSISRSYSSSSLSSISSDSIDKHDKDYRFENKGKPSIGDIDERFPEDIPNDDMLIVDCPIQDDDDLLLNHEQKPLKKQTPSRKTSDRNGENHHQKSSSKDIVKQRKEERQKSPSIQRPVSITVKLNSDEFDLRHLIKKKRRTDESSQNNHRVVQILPKDNNIIVHKTIHDRLSSGRSDKSRSLQKYPKH